MTRNRLIIRSLFHYWRTNLAMLLGVVAGTAVIGGALIVGDSVRGSLRQMTLKRLGQIDYVLSGPRFIREDLSNELQAAAPFRQASVAPAIVMQAALLSRSGGEARRAGQVTVYGVDDRAWSMIQTQIPRPQGTGVVLNTLTAEALNVKVSDEVTVWIELPSAVPRDTLLGRKDNDAQEITLKVAGIADAQDVLSRLGFNPTQALPLNAYVDLPLLQDRLGLEQIKPTRRDPTEKPARVNTLLVASRQQRSLRQASDDAEAFGKALGETWQLADLNLRIADSEQGSSVKIVESEQMILEDQIATAVQSLPQPQSPVMVYLANKLWNPRVYAPGKPAGYSMYSTVAGLDLLDLDPDLFGRFEFVGEKPAKLAEDDVILNEWLATDLQASVGDQIKFSFHVVGSRGELPEEERTVTVRGIVKMTGAAADRNLTPQVKGITDVESLADWDQPFDMDLQAVTPRDDDYWDLYRATPKMFLPLSTARKWWPSRYGSLTSVRIATSLKSGDQSSPLAAEILQRVKPAELGLGFQPVKAIGLMAASGSTDFSGLFFGFSLFLIVAAMILIGLLFRLGIEQRVRDLGLLGAIGFSPRQARLQMLLEGLLVVVAGGVVGLLAAIGYAQLMIYGLTHWWVGAIGTRDLVLEIGAASLPAGFAIAVVAAMVAIGWALRQLNGLSLREQLAGVTEKEVNLAAQRQRAYRARRRAALCAGLALLLTAGIVVRLIPAAGAFFGVGILLLVATLSYLSAWLEGTGPANGNGVAAAQPSALRGQGLVALGRLGLRNASRNRLRSVMTAGMIATATFLIVTVAAFRRDPTGELPDRHSGNGGFTLVAQSSSPVLYDLNTAEGRKKLQLSAPPDSQAARALAAMHVVPFRVKPGDDASCLNLYQTQVPTILGAPQSMMSEGRFAFAMGSWDAISRPAASANAAATVAAGGGGEASGPVVAGSSGSPLIPVLGDLNTLMFSMHKFPGQTIGVPNQQQPLHHLQVAGMFQDSVFQGVLVMSEQNFEKLYPQQKGFRYFLIEVPPELADAATSLLETELAEYGFDCEPVAERLARFLSVQNTYLSTFQTLGGLGLLLGTFGLATVMLRNVLERQSELALLRAVGFRQVSVGELVLLENAFVLSWGLLAGLISALLAVAPNLTSRGGDVPLGSLLLLVTIVFATGMLAAAFAVGSAVRLPIVTTLRGE